MTSYLSLAFKQIKMNKKRTVLFLLGIIISVAMLVTTITMAKSIKDSYIKEARNYPGNYHYAYFEGDIALLKQLSDHILIEDKQAITYFESVPIEGDEDGNSIRLSRITPGYEKMLPFEIKEGRAPQNKQEVVLEEWLYNKYYRDAHIGDHIKVATEHGEEVFTLTGISSSRIASQYERVGEVFAGWNEEQGGHVSIFFRLKDEKHVGDYVEEFSKLPGRDVEFSENYRLLPLLGESGIDGRNQALTMISVILVALIVVATVAVIYNAFHISVMERMKHFGMLRAIGAEPKQIRQLIMVEGMILSFIGIPIGILAGLGGISIVLKMMGSNVLGIESFALSIDPLAISASCVVAFTSVMISVLLPAHTASSISPIEVIRSGGKEQKKLRKRQKKTKIPFYSYAIELAKRNIGRNKKRFLLTAFSIAISVVLFIVFHHFIQSALEVVPTDNESTDVTYIAYGSYSDEPEDAIQMREQFEELKRMPEVERIYPKYQRLFGNIFPEEKERNQDLLWAFEQSLDGKTYIGATILVYDQSRIEALKPYIKSGKVNFEKMEQEHSAIILQRSEIYDPVKEQSVIDQWTYYEPGDKVTVNMDHEAYVNNDDGDEQANIVRKKDVELNVSAVLKKGAFSEEINYDKTVVVIITPQTAAKLTSFFSSEEKQAFHIPSKPDDIFGMDIYLTEKADREKMNQYMEMLEVGKLGMHVIYAEDDLKQQKNFQTQLQVFVYGFISLIALVSSLNILNTVNTNIILRRKEFAMLRAVGMTMAQIKAMVLLEGVLYSLIGCIVGITGAIGITFLLHLQMNGIKIMSYTWPIQEMIFAVIGATLIGIGSVIFPLRKMKKMNMVEGLREENE